MWGTVAHVAFVVDVGDDDDGDDDDGDDDGDHGGFDDDAGEDGIGNLAVMVLMATEVVMASIAMMWVFWWQ